MRKRIVVSFIALFTGILVTSVFAGGGGNGSRSQHRYGGGNASSTTMQNQHRQQNQYQHRYQKQRPADYSGDQMRTKNRTQQRINAADRAIDNSLRATTNN